MQPGCHGSFRATRPTGPGLPAPSHPAGRPPARCPRRAPRPVAGSGAGGSAGGAVPSAPPAALGGGGRCRPAALGPPGSGGAWAHGRQLLAPAWLGLSPPLRQLPWFSLGVPSSSRTEQAGDAHFFVYMIWSAWKVLG